VELAGHAGTTTIEKVKTVGPEAEKEKDDGLKWLNEETSATSPFGVSVTNEYDWVKRFGDLRISPVVEWLEKKGLLDQNRVEHPDKLRRAETVELLELLTDSKG